VLDDGPIGGGETGRTTAHLASAVDDRYFHLEQKFGRGGARIVAESHTTAIDYIEAMARELTIDCDFRRVDGYLIKPPGHHPTTIATSIASWSPRIARACRARWCPRDRCRSRRDPR